MPRCAMWIQLFGRDTKLLGFASSGVHMQPLQCILNPEFATQSKNISIPAVKFLALSSKKPDGTETDLLHWPANVSAKQSATCEATP